MPLQVYMPGTTVYLGPVGDGLEVTVLALQFREWGVTSYEVSWWNGRSRQTAWVDPCETRPGADTRFLRVTGEKKPNQVGEPAGEG